MVRTMYDAIDASKLPTGGDLYAGYVDGNWPSYSAIVKRFPGKLVVGIATNPNTNDGIIGDGPPDNGTWSEWIGWVQRRRAAGKDPWINTNQMNNWTAGIEAFRAANVGEPHWWVADYDNNPVLPAGALMKQYASNNDYDTSSCATYLPGIDPAPTPTPVPTPAPIPVEEDDMIILYVDGTSEVYGLSGGKLWHITDVESLSAYEAAGVKQVHKVTQEEINAIKVA